MTKVDSSRLQRIRVAVAVILDGDRCLVQQRRAGGHLPSFWEFPGGKLELEESPLEALFREVFEETGIRLAGEALEHLMTQAIDYPDRKVVLHFFLCRLSCRPKVTSGRWVPLADLKRYAFPPANQKVLDYLKTLSTR